ncbi:ABC transporter substrate-binding protein [Paenibacillus sp. N4]|uniref:ABC transporter substrate-binding protein n=1 Tax=Paenibacillus vietnamensis TaxID=2590547 RepID=UPI001CD17168|nr:ABC transporter substrate-binding protein [Paenibacillus vietnamensis]MCA0758228.1 ABC transporter substrate-binding protein [Paenibacillus vietnamensis]
MKNRMFHSIGALLLAVSLSSCGKAAPRADEPSPEAADQKLVLEVLNPKVEISTQFEQMVREYEKENPNVELKLLTFGGGSDYLTELKARFASNQGPDIFPNGGYEEAHEWRLYLEDLSDQPWVSLVRDEALEPMRIDGKTYGMPYNYEGYGFIYNKDLFAKAGIGTPPKTFSELRTAVEKLHAAGILPFEVGYADSWKFILLLNIAFASQDNPDSFIRGLYDGTQTIEGNKVFEELLRTIDLTVQYGNADYLTTDYSTEVKRFAAGEAAILMQGNWVQFKLDQLTPHMNIGFLPISINDDAGNDALPLGISNNWAINKDASPEKKREAKKFLNWMITSKQGKSFMRDRFHYISAFKHIGTLRSGPLVNDLVRYADEKKTLTWNWFKFPPRVREEYGYMMQAYVGKELNREQLLRELQRIWEKAVQK